MKKEKWNKIIISKDVANIFLLISHNYKNRIDYLKRENKISFNKLEQLEKNIKIINKGIEQISLQINQNGGRYK